MKFLPLIDLRLSHEYYTDRQCSDFLVEPTPSTRQLLDNYRWVLKTAIDGVRVFAAANDDNTPFISLRPGLMLAFHLQLRNPDFALFTDLTQLAHTALPIYANDDTSAGNPVPLALRTPEDSPGERRPPRTGNVFADVEIHYGEQLPEIAGGPKEFQVSFQARQARWVYYVVTDDDDGQFRIEDKSAQPLMFGDPNPIDLSRQPDPADQIAQALAQQYPELRLLRFVSDDLIACRQQARRSIQLRLDGSQVIAALPNPALYNCSTVQVTRDGSAQREDALFHVVKYFNRQSQTTGG